MNDGQVFVLLTVHVLEIELSSRVPCNFVIDFDASQGHVVVPGLSEIGSHC